MFDYFQNYQISEIKELLQTFDAYANRILADNANTDPEFMALVSAENLQSDKTDLKMFLSPTQTFNSQELRLLVRRLSLSRLLKDLLFNNLLPQERSGAIEELLWSLPRNKYHLKKLLDGSLQIDLKNEQTEAIAAETKQNFANWSTLETISDEFITTKLQQARTGLPQESDKEKINLGQYRLGQIASTKTTTNEPNTNDTKLATQPLAGGPQAANRLSKFDFSNKSASRFIGGSLSEKAVDEPQTTNIYSPNLPRETTSQKPGLFGKLAGSLELGLGKTTKNLAAQQKNLNSIQTARRESQIRQRRKKRKQTMAVAATIGATGMFASAPIIIDLLT